MKREVMEGRTSLANNSSYTIESEDLVVVQLITIYLGRCISPFDI